ncbi:MAG: glycoside hydrolase family 3 protein [Lachnospiraceae bacterium]|nr:glycoside hydrolase family 3 protein [Lachnospiraceae bacterium]
MMDLTKAPFELNEKQVKWVEDTLGSMALEEKIGALFCPIGYSTDRDYLDHELLRYHIGGLFFRDGLGKEMQETFAYAQKKSRIPLLIPSNIEAGGDGAAIDGTPYGKQMAVAAANNSKYAYRLGKIAASEASALGVNWAFAPVVDLDINFRNPITNVRTYGDSKERVIENATEYLRAAREEGVATAVKHFPGDGIDERDQHLLTSVNTLSMEEWDETYGEIYKAMIEEKTLTIMVGHIALPSYENYFEPSHQSRIIPASLSKPLLSSLLREKLGFNGLVITDATPMVGFTSAMDRRSAVPLAIENGCDMFLFNKDLEEDYRYMMEGYRNGLLSEQRLLDANRRILALKAALLLPEKKTAGNLVPDANALQILGCDEHRKWSEELADRAITLVKDTNRTLPLSPKKTKRILLEVMGDYPSSERVLNTAKDRLESYGFDVYVYEKEDFQKGVDNVSDFHEKYDAVLYLANIENCSNQTTARLNWYTFWGQGNNVPWFANEVPVVFASLQIPYHLLDVPMIKTYINTYSNSDHFVKSLIDKIVGKGGFHGINPVDPFCKREDLKY